jgi:hypothetical protein
VGLEIFREALPLRETAPEFAAGLAPLEWPLRWTQEGAEDLAERVPEALPDGRAVALPFPLE